MGRVPHASGPSAFAGPRGIPKRAGWISPMLRKNPTTRSGETEGPMGEGGTEVDAGAVMVRDLHPTLGLIYFEPSRFRRAQAPGARSATWT